MSKHLFQVLDELWEVFASMKFHRLPEFKSPKSVKTERVFFLNFFQIQNMRLPPKLDRLSIEQH